MTTTTNGAGPTSDLLAYLEEGPDSDPPESPSGLTVKRTDLANAETMRRIHGENMRYVGAWKKWLAWDGKRWQLDTDALALHYATETVRAMADDAANLLHLLLGRMRHEGVTEELTDLKAEADADFAHAVQSQHSRKLMNMLHVATGFREFATKHADLDVDPWMLNVGNGTLDLRTGKLFPHMRTELITMLSPPNYDEEATCPTWAAFLERCMGGSGQMVAYLQRLVGYTMTGITTEHVFAFHYGSGANGKSTFLGVLHGLMGEYGAPAHPRLIFRSQGGGDRHLTERASLFRKRFITCPETSESVSFDEATVKDLTGGDIIAARRMREDEWNFYPTHKIHLAGNEKPIVRATDDGFWRRVHLIPWTVTIPVEERDHQLGEKLRAEMPGILAWAVRGCLEWQRVGLAVPDSITAAVHGYRQQSDTFGLFLASRCSLAHGYTITRRELREAYELWCREQGYEPLGARRVAEALRRHGVSDARVRTGMSVADGWDGVTLQNG